MRSSQVAPFPRNEDDSRRSTPVGISTTKLSKRGVAKMAHKTEIAWNDTAQNQKERMRTGVELPSGMYHAYGGKAHVFSTLDPVPPVMACSSISMEEDTVDDANPRLASDDVKEYHPKKSNAASYLMDHERNDELSQPSTDDPYTYSDDSASLSDAYFLQQSPDISIQSMQPRRLGQAPIIPSGDYNNTDHSMWPGPPWMHLNNGLSANKNDHWKRQRNGNSLSPDTIEEDELINEGTSLLTNGGRRMLEKRPSYERKRRKSGGEDKRSCRPGKCENPVELIEPIVNSDAHRQHRRKHEMRKYQRNLILQQHQERQEQRERAVSEIRGKLQPASTKKDRFWSALFILQIVAVCASAAKYGLTIYSSPRGFKWHTSSIQSTDASQGSGSSSEVNSSLESSMTAMLTRNDSIQEQFEVDDRSFSIIASSDDGSDDADESIGVRKTPTKEHALTIDYQNVLIILMISGMYACVTSYLSLAFMLILARSIIPIMLVFTILLLLSWGVFGLSLDSNAGSLLSLGGFTVFALSFAYTIANWNHIPFCSTNLFAAICALRSSVGMLMVGIASLFVGLLWLFIWSVALIGMFNEQTSSECMIMGSCETHVYMSGGEILELSLLMTSTYWTTMVIKNILRVTTAGAIGGRWWFSPVYNHTGTENGNENMQESKEKCACWNASIVSDPLVRACTTSFGTICFGSLVDIPAQIISKTVTILCLMVGCTDADTTNEHLSSMISDEGPQNEAKVRQGQTIGNEKEGTGTIEDGLTLDIDSHSEDSSNCFRNIRKSLSRLDRHLQSYNRWSYIYIGMYNYSFYEGGKKAIELFETREWMEIARDSLIQNIFLMASIVIGGSVGIMAVLVEEVDGYEFTSLHKPIITSFLIGFVVGFTLSNILFLGLAGAAVNTILVCFAAEPFEFDRNHPHLSREMREVWSQQVWEPQDNIS